MGIGYIYESKDMVHEYFDNCIIHTTKESAMKEAAQIEETIMNSKGPVLEYGIVFIHWEDIVY